MKLIRWLLLLLLVLGWIIVGSLPPHELGETSLQAMPVSQVPNTPPAETSSALKFDLQKLSQTLDDKDIAAAIQQVELGWKKQFEDYYQGPLCSWLRIKDTVSKDCWPAVDYLKKGLKIPLDGLFNVTAKRTFPCYV